MWLLAKQAQILWSFALTVTESTGQPRFTRYFPVCIWCQNDVVSTSMRRHHVVSTFIRRHFYVKCRLGLKLLPVQLCMTRTVRADAVKRPAHFGPFRSMYYPNGQSLDEWYPSHKRFASWWRPMKHRMTNDTGVVRGLPVNGDQWQAKKNWSKIELTNIQMFPQNR